MSEACTQEFRRGNDDGMHRRGRLATIQSLIVAADGLKAFSAPVLIAVASRDTDRTVTGLAGEQRALNPANAHEFLSVPEVGGALIGGASLKAQDFNAIIRALPVQAPRIVHSVAA